jgi:hypothetical protein
LFAAWYDTLRRGEEAMAAVLQFLRRSPRTWRAGHAIRDAISPISAALCTAGRYAPEIPVNALGADIGDKLSRFDATPLLDELAAAVMEDCAAQLRLPSPAAPPAGDSTATAPGGVSSQATAVNLFQLNGTVLHVHYEESGEEGVFPDRSDSVLRHLARLLAEPNRRFHALDFYPPPPGEAPLPHYGRDTSSDERAAKEYEERLRQLAREIKEADDAHDTETAGRLREEFERLAAHHKREKAARKCGHEKRCGTPSPEEKADQALRVGLERAKNRFRESKLPKLADHLDKYLDNGGCEWWYAPPPETSPWHVIIPDQRSKK